MNFGKGILKEKFRMKDLGAISLFLGIQFSHFEDGSITMDQTEYLKSVLQKYGMEDCKPRYSPCDPKPHYDPEDKEIVDEPTYRAVVGSLVYAMTCTRPDLSWAVTRLSQHLSCPVAGDWAILKQVLRYVKGTLQHKLHFTKAEQMKLEGFSDSDWAANEEDRRSTIFA